MQIVDEEDDRAAGDSWRRRWRGCCVAWVAESRELLFTRTARRDTLEERDRTRLAIDDQLKLLAFQSFDEVAFLVENRDSSLDEFDVRANNVGLLCTCRQPRDENNQTNQIQLHFYTPRTY